MRHVTIMPDGQKRVLLVQSGTLGLALKQMADTSENAAIAQEAAQQAEAARDDTINGLAAKANKNGSDITSADDWRTALDLGDAAVLNVGSTAGTVAAGDDERIVAVASKLNKVATLADLEALPNTIAQVFCQGRAGPDDGYAGVFEWIAGDRSAAVSSDALKGIWVAPASDPTGASGARKRIFDGSVNVRWFSAGLGGDDTAAFSAAARLAFVTDYIGGAYQTSLARPFRGYVSVPAGNYVLSSVVDTGGRDIVWDLDQAAIVDVPANLNGTIRRGDSRTTTKNPFGISEYATGFMSSVGGLWADRPAPVTGITTLQQLANYNDRDAVGILGAGYSSKALINVATATYTATSVTLTAPSDDVVKSLRRGMIIDTKHTTRCTALISSWVVAGGNLTITVDEWRARGGSSAVTPANGTGLYVSLVTKVWGANFVGHLAAGDDTNEAIGVETTVYNTKADSSSTIGTATNRVVGKYVYSAGPFKIQSGYQFAGDAHYGFTALNSENGFYAISPAGKPGAAFLSLGYNTILNGINASNQQTFNLSSSGNMELGNISAASTVYADYHTSGNNTDYDVRVSVSGGTATLGQGAYAISAGSVRFSATQMGFFGNTVVSRQTYGAPTGVGNRLTFDTESVTLVELARRVKSLIDDLRQLGLIGTAV